MRSPNELLQGAREIMLDGREPVTRKDWQLVVNFLSANIAPEVQPAAVLIFRHLYDIPLTDEEITEICLFQTKEKK